MTLRELVYRKFNERLTLVKEHLYNAPSWEEYQRLRGVYQGMNELMRDIDPYIKDPESAEDEEESK